MWRLNKPSSLRALLPLLLLLPCLVGESTRDGQRPISPALRLLVELLQIAVSLMLYIVAQRKPSNWILLSEPEKDELSEIPTIPTGSSRFYALGSIIGALFAVQAFTRAQKIRNLTELHLMFPQESYCVWLDDCHACIAYLSTCEIHQTRSEHPAAAEV
ncbi:hypothetical protein R3P38DRAFT_3016449 [Favolaschia claudopus]|uniref:Uncharacterized protein n=1 Tax=Favolaschia claudopus TaxID=2862362 RepID=A0AAW0AIK8_9AGAR